jgi:hypothetical protein
LQPPLLLLPLLLAPSLQLRRLRRLLRPLLLWRLVRLFRPLGGLWQCLPAAGQPVVRQHKYITHYYTNLAAQHPTQAPSYCAVCHAHPIAVPPAPRQQVDTSSTEHPSTSSGHRTSRMLGRLAGMYSPQSATTSTREASMASGQSTTPPKNDMNKQ